MSSSASQQTEQTLRSLWATARIFLRNLKGHAHEPESPYQQYILSDDDICLHIGASDGRHSYLMKKYAPNATIHAFEPASYNVRVFKRLIALHGLKQVQVHGKAIGDKPGEFNLVTPIKTNGHIGRSFAFITPDANAKRANTGSGQTISERVEVITMDDFCAQHTGGRVDFIRCDIEGSEMAALKGGWNVISKNLPNILLEIHPPLLAEHFGTTGEAVRDMILALGYRMFHLSDHGLVESTALVEGPWKDYFFIHPSRADRLPAGFFRDALAATPAAKAA